ncbi:MAG TPA: M1 family aminopeptidase [Candidatus Acidoferrales bacterium]
MNRRASRSLYLVLFPILLLLCGYSCDAPLAPGYLAIKESGQVRFLPSDPPTLQITAHYKFENSGTSDLTFIDVALPNQRAFGLQDLEVTVNGSQVTPSALSQGDQYSQTNILRLPLDPPWARKQTRDVSIEYAFRSPTNRGPRITLDKDDFHLGSQGWFPQFQPPKHLMARAPSRPDRTDYTIRVPADFLVLARGAPKGKKKTGSEIEYRFELSKDDLSPYIVAGRYMQWPAGRNSQSASFWTLQPLKGDPAPAGQEITSAWHTLETAFGPLDKNVAAPHIVESAQLRRSDQSQEGPAAVTAFPGGAIVNPAALDLGVDNSQFLDIVSHALAHNWFGDELAPTPDAALGLGEGLPEYATIVIEEARNGPAARRDRILRYLQRYEEARKQANETPLGLTMLTDPIAQRRIALAKAPLFFIELEDICGEAPMRSGLAHLVALLRGQELGYDDLRSALEQTTNRDLAKPFRVWLNEKGIPQDFLDRYPLSSAVLQNGQ